MPERPDYLDEVEERFDKLEALPKRDITEARLTYAALAHSANPADRKEAASLIGALTEVDHDFGLALWKDLIVDDDPDVMEAAYECVVFYMRGIEDGSALEAIVAKEGLTLADAISLVDTHVRELTRRVQGDQVAPVSPRPRNAPPAQRF